MRTFSIPCILAVSLALACSSEVPEDSDVVAPVNEAPSAPQISLPDASMHGDDLVCSITEQSVDPEGEPVTYTYSWTVDGSDAGIDADTIPGDQVGAWQDWECAVVASDGNSESQPVTATITTTDECVSLAANGVQLVGADREATQALDVGGNGEPITMEGWFRLQQPQPGEGDVLFYKGDLTTGPSSWTLDYMLSVGNNGDIHFATAKSGSGDPCNYLVVPTDLPWNEWLHLAATYDTASRSKQLFVNGTRVHSCTASRKNAAANGPLTVGGHMMIVDNQRLYPTHQISGNVDEVRISRSVRYTADFTPAPWLRDDADTQLLYHFNEGSGSTVEDASSNGYDGMLLTSTWTADDSACEGYWDLTD